MVLSIWPITLRFNVRSWNWTSKVVTCVTLINSGPNRSADFCNWWPEWVEVIMAGMVFRKSCQQCGMTGDGSEIDKHVIRAGCNTSQVWKYLFLLSLNSPFMKREGCGKKYTIFGALAQTLFTSLLTSWKAVHQLYMSKSMAWWLGSSHDSMVKLCYSYYYWLQKT